jgi:xanthine/CO dehydrogenase XdhC/CoxF family maturation factor
MKELAEIVKACDRASAEGKRAALATVVSVEGSSYRRPGARMLILDDGGTAGSVSGGCLEADVVRAALDVIAAGRSKCLRYDTTDDDVVFGIGLGCNGIIRIAVEPVTADLLALLRRSVEARVDTVIAVRYSDDSAATAFSISGATPASAVDREFAAAHKALADRRHAWLTLLGGEQLFLQFCPPPVPLILFGAGHDAVPLAALAKSIGWRVTVVDHRPAYADPGRFPTADEVIHARPEKVREAVTFDDRTVGVVMSHAYSVDLEILSLLLSSDLAFIGLLGPKSRGTRMVAELRDRGQVIGDEQLRRIHSPVGLDIGGDTPELIALSILSEIQAVLAGRNGGMLRDRSAPIYDPLPGSQSIGIVAEQ